MFTDLPGLHRQLTLTVQTEVLNRADLAVPAVWWPTRPLDVVRRKSSPPQAECLCASFVMYGDQSVDVRYAGKTEVYGERKLVLEPA